MKRFLIALLIGGALGAGAGFAAGIFIYPFWFLTDVAAEKLDPAYRVELAAGRFVHVDRSDPVHWGQGRVTLHRGRDDDAAVFLNEDFAVGPGPRFHVYLVAHANVVSKADFNASDKVDLGRLRAFKGSQVYRLPPGVDPLRFASVVIWCKEFHVLISPASLSPTAPTH